MADSGTTAKQFPSQDRGDACFPAMFNRAHSLEKDDASGTDSDVESQEIQDFLDALTVEELWDSMLESLEAPESHNFGLQISALIDLNSESNSTTQLPGGKSERHRKRVTNKQKISRLHKEVETLTSRLHSFQTHSKKSSHFSMPRRQLWQQIAAKQLKLRQQAEEENDQLREMMKIQVQEARNLRRILKRRTRIEMLEDMLGMKRQKINPFDLSATALASEKMLHSVDELYAQADVLFSESGMNKIPCPGRKRQMDSTVLNGVCYKLLERKLVPFNITSTADAVWHALGQQEVEGLPSVGKASSRHYDYVAGLHVAKAVRRYVEHTRTVFVYRTTMEPKLCGVTGPAGLRMTSTLLVELRNESVTDSSEPMTLIQTLFSAERHDDGLAAAERLRLPTNMGGALTVCDDTIDQIHLQIERFLVDAMFPTLTQRPAAK